MDSAGVDVAELLGRRAECDAVAQLLAGAPAERSGMLVMRGAAGTGKTVLLDSATLLVAGLRRQAGQSADR